MDTVDTLALAMGAAWASGINLYAAVFVLGYLNLTGDVVLPPELQVLSDPLVLAAAALMYCVEFFADKTPGVDTGWDTLHTFVRIPAGAVLAAGAVAQVGPAAELAAFLVGGGLAASSHFTKAGARVLINTSPEPVSNWAASISEDLLVLGGLWTALHYPLAYLLALAAFLALVVWALPRLWRGIRRVLSSVARWFGRHRHGNGAPPGDPGALPPPGKSRRPTPPR